MKHDYEMKLKLAPSQIAANVKHIELLFEIIDLYITAHTYLKQVYMLDFSLEDNHVRARLKEQETKMEMALADLTNQLHTVTSPAQFNGFTLPNLLFQTQS